jgi:CRP-like cAMP-binding protein
MSMENLILSMRRLHPVSDGAIDLLASNLTEHYFAPKEMLMRAGHRYKRTYLIEKGITRSFLLIGGKDMTNWFSVEGHFAGGSLDQYRNEPSFENIEALEDVKAYSISIQTLNELYRKSIDLANWARVLHQEIFLIMQALRIDRLNLSAKDRYEKLRREYPNICNRVNLGHIASYLGITLPTLSKLRAEKSIF